MTCIFYTWFRQIQQFYNNKNKISGTQQLQNACWIDSLHHRIKSNESDCCPQPSITQVALVTALAEST